MRVFAVLIAGLVLVSTAGGQESADFKIIAARNAATRYREDLASARKRFDAQAATARESFVRAMKPTMAAATKSGDLDEANRIKAAIEEAESAKPGPDATDAPAGRWRMKYPGSGEQIVTFEPGGKVTLAADGKTFAGKLIQRGGEWHADFGDNDGNRVTITGKRLFFEHWRGRQPGDFPDSVAVGYPAK